MRQDMPLTDEQVLPRPYMKEGIMRSEEASYGRASACAGLMTAREGLAVRKWRHTHTMTGHDYRAFRCNTMVGLGQDMDV